MAGWHLVAVGISLVSVMTGTCHSYASHPSPARQSLEDLEEDFWQWRMMDAPIFSTAVGQADHNDALESFDKAVYPQRRTAVEQFLHRLQAMDRGSLDTGQQLDYDIFSDHLHTFLNGSLYNDYFAMNSVNFLEGINADAGHMQTIMPFSSLGDYENYLQRLLRLPHQIDQKIDLLKVSVTTGLTMNNMSVVAVPEQISFLVQKRVQDSDFYKPAFTITLERASHIPADKKASLRARAREAVEQVHAALSKLGSYLQDSYLAATRPSWGLDGLTGGRAMYLSCLRYHTSTDLTPQQVHSLGLHEVARITDNMHQALRRLNFTGTSKQFYASIRNDSKFHMTSAELLETYNDMIFRQIFPKLRTMFNDIPDLPLEVRAMSYDGPGGVYMSGTPDGAVPGVFYVNVMHPQELVTIGMMALVLHETIPGHHLQNVYSLTSHIPKYRAFMEDDHYYRMPATFPINTAYLEGWGLYAEYLGEELGLYTDDYTLMGRYSEEIFRACRLVVDTGLHYYGWDRERAIQYLVDHTAMGRGEVSLEVDRYLTWPAQATAYKIGEIKIKQLRQRASQALGERFRLADFHSVLLSNGGMPLGLLERLVEQWIDEVKGVTTSTASTGTPGAGSDALIG